MNSTIPTLSMTGFSKNKSYQMQKCMEYFLASDYSQSSVHMGKIKSLKHLLVENQQDLQALKTAMESALQELYGNYFDRALASVEIKEDPDSSIVNFVIWVEAEDEGRVYTSKKEISGTKGEIINFEEEIDQLYKLYGLSE